MIIIENETCEMHAYIEVGWLYILKPQHQLHECVILWNNKRCQISECFICTVYIPYLCNFIIIMITYIHIYITILSKSLMWKRNGCRIHVCKILENSPVRRRPDDILLLKISSKTLWYIPPFESTIISHKRDLKIYWLIEKTINIKQPSLNGLSRGKPTLIR